MSQLGTVYATKRRRRNGKSLKPPPKDGVTKSNPSKRHRERLNAELDLLASLLPFEQNILSKLDRLSILRLSVSYLRTKSYFQVVMHKENEENGMMSHIHPHDGYRNRELGAFEHGLLDGDMFLQALNGFLMILTCEGEVFFATHSIESYLGFHQSDIVHQSVYELVHSEDREELQRQLLWNSFLPQDMSSMSLAETLAPDKFVYLERSFTVRFRCLLDNTSGFLRLDIRGRVKILHGQNRKMEEPPLGLFAYCTPFGPPSLLEIPQKENMFKSKHKLDLSLVSMDQRGKIMLGYSDSELANMGGYDLVHFDDLSYVASAHQELLKTGASGMIAYRFQKKDGEWQWLQTSSRLVYKNSKPDFVICTHRQLMEEEGRDLLGKRTMDFKVSYLDAGLSSTYFTEADQLIVPPTGSPAIPPAVQPRTNRRYKTQLRDFLSTCRSKRKLPQQSPHGQVAQSSSAIDYMPDPAAAVAAAYSNLNPMYTTSAYPSAAENLYMTPSVHSSSFYPVADNLFHQYRLQAGVGGYYPDYHHSPTPASYVTNGFLSYEDKWQESKYYSTGDTRAMYGSGYASPTASQILPSSHKTPKPSPPVIDAASCSSGGPSPAASVSSVQLNQSTTANNSASNNINSSSTNNSSSANTTSANTSNGILPITPKVEHSPPQHYEPQRQTVLMWGTSQSNSNNNNNSTSNNNNHSSSSRSPNSTPTNNLYSHQDSHGLKLSNHLTASPVTVGEEVAHHHHNSHQHHSSNSFKWNGTNKELTSGIHVYSIHQSPHEAAGSMDPATAASMYAQIPQGHHSSGHLISAASEHTMHQSGHAMNNPQTSSCEVWAPSTYSQYQYFTYHHAPQHASTQSPLVDTTTQSHCLSRNNGYPHSDHHHHHQHHHGTISPISPLTQLSHTGRTPITRTGVLCCPSLM